MPTALERPIVRIPSLKTRRAPKQHKYTAEEFFGLDFPEHEKWELVDGVLVKMPSPEKIHQLLLKILIVEIELWLRKHPIGELIPDWDVKFLTFDTRRPDLVFGLFKDSRLKRGRHGEGTPDFLVEIISPGGAKRDLVEKRLFYEKCGVQEYWVIDPLHRNIHLFQPDASGRYIETVLNSGSVKSKLLKGFTVKLNDLFKVIDEYDGK